jgi:hypothetical protein
MATYPDWVPAHVRRIAERRYARMRHIDIPTDHDLDDYADTIDPHGVKDGAFHLTRLPERDPDE